MIYEKIKQPYEWASFVRTHNHDHKCKSLTDPRLLMSVAVQRYKELKSFTGEYQASTSTTDETIALLGDKIAELGQRFSQEQGPHQDSATFQTPPFSTDTTNPGNTPYKEGDTQPWKGKTYRFHVASIHKDNRRWFLHTCSECKLCDRWKESNSSAGSTANLSDMTSDAPADQAETLLAQAYDLFEGMPNGTLLQTYIADTITALHE